MGLCEIIAKLADAVATYANCSDLDQLRIHVFRLAPRYRDERGLVEWDKALRYGGMREPINRSPTEECLDGLEELGSMNLYGAFDLPGTRQQLNEVLKLFRKHGIPVPSLHAFSDW